MPPGSSPASACPGRPSCTGHGRCAGPAPGVLHGPRAPGVTLGPAQPHPPVWSRSFAVCRLLTGLPPRAGRPSQRQAFLKAPPAHRAVAEEIQAGGLPVCVLANRATSAAQPCWRQLCFLRSGAQRRLGTRSEAALSRTCGVKTMNLKCLPYFPQKWLILDTV